MPVLTVEKPLREKLGDEATDSLVRLISQSQQEQKNGMLEFVEEKFERRLSEEIGKLNISLSKEIAGTKTELKTDTALLKTELKTDTASLKTELKADIASTRAELIKWMFIFWIGQVAATLGILFTFFKK